MVRKVTPNAALIQQYFDYLRLSTGMRGDAAVIFGRHDHLVAKKATEVFNRNYRTIKLVPTGGVGKDSGSLKQPEAEWLTSILCEDFNVPTDFIHPEIAARNGGENARNSLAILQSLNLKRSIQQLVLVIHATSARRLAATMEHEAKKAGWNINLVVAPTDYKFNANSAKDQKECVGEIMRLMLYGLQKMLVLPAAFWPMRTQGLDGMPVHAEHAIALGRQFEPSVYNDLMKQLNK